jgi:glycogen debranching enzyme
VEIPHHADSLFHVDRIPFSFFGAWFSISVPRDEQELFLCNHHGEGANLFPLKTLEVGEVVIPEILAKPWCLTLATDHGKVEICFESTKTLRLRGEGLGLQMGRRNLVHSCGPNLFTFNVPFSRRYQVEVLRGGSVLHRMVPTQPVFPVIAEIIPDENGRWELAIDEFGSTWVRPERSSFDECLTSARKSFCDFLSVMPPVRPQDGGARELATYVDWCTAVEPCGLVKRTSILMSKRWMNQIWSWDHCFNAMALAKGHPNLALDQMLTMVDHQDEFGCYPDSINDLKITYNFSKPPVHGLAFKEMLRRLPGSLSVESMTVMYDSLSRQADWWMTHRVLDGHHLPHYLHGNDIGWDNSTMFNEGVPLVAPDLSSLLIVQMDCLSEIAFNLGKKDEAVNWKHRADRLQTSLVEELWNEDHFVARVGTEGTVVESQSLIPWLPIILGRRLPEEMLAALKKGIKGHLTEWGLATERVDSPLYQEDGYWTGPIWAPSTYLAVVGLDSSGFDVLADEISEKFCRMCGNSGFAENFNAVTGQPLRCPAYTWTSSVFLLLAERMKEREIL